MEIRIKDIAREKLTDILKQKHNSFFKISLVRYDCNGPVLSLVTSSNPDSLEAIQVDGFNFIMREEDKEVFETLEIDYAEEGLRSGFTVNVLGSLLKSCYFDQEEVE